MGGQGRPAGGEDRDHVIVEQQALLHAGEDLVAHVQLSDGIGAVVELVVPVVIAHRDLGALHADRQGLIGIKAVLHDIGGVRPADHHAVRVHLRAAPGAVDHVVLAALHGVVVVLILDENEADAVFQRGALRGGEHRVLDEVDHLLIGGVGAVDVVFDLHDVRFGDVAVGEALVIGGLQQPRGLLPVVAGQVVDALHAVDLAQRPLGSLAVAVGQAGDGIADVHLVEQAEGRVRAGGAALDIVRAVEGVGHGPAEVKERAGVLEDQREGVRVVLYKADPLPRHGLHDAVFAEEIVDQIALGLVVPGVAAGEGIQRAEALLRRGDEAVRVRLGQEQVVGLLRHVRGVIIEAVAAQPVKALRPVDAGPVAGRVGVLSVLPGGEGLVGQPQLRRVGEPDAAGLVAVVVILRVGQRGSALIEQGGAVVLHAGIQELLQGVFHVMGGDGRAVLPDGVLAQLHLPGIALRGVRGHAVDLVARIAGGHVHGELGGQLADDVIAVLRLVHPKAVERGRGIAEHVVLRGDLPVRGGPGGHAGIRSVIGVGAPIRQRRHGAGEGERNCQGGCKQRTDPFLVHGISSL